MGISSQELLEKGSIGQLITAKGGLKLILACLPISGFVIFGLSPLVGKGMFLQALKGEVFFAQLIMVTHGPPLA